MIHSTKDVLVEIETTIDQLVENANVLKTIASSNSYEEEKEALEKTQESLIAHLIHMDEMLKKKNSSRDNEPLCQAMIHDKLGRSGYLNQVLQKKNQVEEHLQTKPKIHKRRHLAKKIA